MDDFFYLSDACNRGAVELGFMQPMEYPERLLLGDATAAAPIALKQYSGRRWFDLHSSGWPGLYVLSERVFAALNDCSATGWSRFRVVIRDKRGSAVPGYAGLSIHGRAGPLDLSMSRRHWFEKPCPEGRGHWGMMGCYFRPETWDGNDVFIPEKTWITCVTGRVQRALNDCKARNIELRSLSEVENMQFPWEFGPSPENHDT